MTALPKDQAVVLIQNNDTVATVNKQGEILNDIYIGSDIQGVLVQGSDLFVLHLNGTIVKMQPEDGHIVKVYNTGISFLHNYASQHTDLCHRDLDELLLPDLSPPKVYTYNISSETLKLRVDSLNAPSSVTHGCVDGSVVYVVCEHTKFAPMVHLYNASWSLITSFGSYGTGDGQLRYPYSAVMTDHGSIIVGDYSNARVSMFTSDGRFVKHIIIYDVPYYESQDHPRSLSVIGQYLWVANNYGRLTRYIL